MPVNLTEADEFTANVSVPVPLEAGSIADGSPLKNGLQALANRTRHFYNRLTSGVKRIQYFSDLADLRDVTGMSAGDVSVVNDTYLGLYVYDAAATGAEVYPWSIKPTGKADIDPGRWRHIFNTFGVTSATLGDNKWIFNSPGRVVEALEAVVTSPSSNVYSDSASWQDVGLSLTKTLVIGDIIQLAATTVWAVDTTDSVSYRLRVEAPGGNSVLDGSQHEVNPIAANKKNLFHATGKWTAAEVGSHTFKLQILVQAGGSYNATLYAQRALHGLWIRP